MKVESLKVFSHATSVDCVLNLSLRPRLGNIYSNMNILVKFLPTQINKICLFLSLKMVLWFNSFIRICFVWLWSFHWIDCLEYFIRCINWALPMLCKTSHIHKTPSNSFSLNQWMGYLDHWWPSRLWSASSDPDRGQARPVTCARPEAESVWFTWHLTFPDPGRVNTLCLESLGQFPDDDVAALRYWLININIYVFSETRRLRADLPWRL